MKNTDIEKITFRFATMFFKLIDGKMNVLETCEGQNAAKRRSREIQKAGVIVRRWSKCRDKDVMTKGLKK